MKREAPPEDLGRPAKQARSSGSGQAASGRIVSFFAQKGYGFIQSNVSSKDVFFPKVALPPELQDLDLGLLKGMEVNFTFLELDGKPRAEAVSSKLPMLPPGRPERAPLRPGVSPSGQAIHTGTLRSYDAKKGFGFILPDDLPEDIFYLRSELPPELDGIEPTRNQVVDRRVDFEVKQMENGKLRAQRLRFLALPPMPGGPILAAPRAMPAMPALPAPAAPRQPSAPSGRDPGFSQGRIRSFYPSKGYGFIEANGQPDLFFLPSSLPKELVESKQPLEGMEITFEAYTNEEGKARARNIQPFLPPPPRSNPPPHLTRGPPPPPVHMVQMLPPPPMAPMVPQAISKAEPQILVGLVHSYDVTKGFGFMRADGFTGDIFFNRSELPAEFREQEKEKVVGTHMEFELQTMRDGKFRGRKLLHLRRVGGGPRARGRVIKYHMDKGYGFMDCGWADNVFFLRSSLPKDLNDATLEELQQMEISFEVSSKEPGKPRANFLEILGRERGEAKEVPQNGELLTGEIVNFDPAKDFGFVRASNCEQDIYFGRSDLPAELVGSDRKEEVMGERVEFEVEVKSDGKMRAHLMRLLAAGDEPESDLDNDLVTEMEDFLVENGNRQNYGNFTNRFPRVKKSKIQKHFQIVDGDGRQYVELPQDHPRRNLAEEVAPPEEEMPKDSAPTEDYVDDFPEAPEAPDINDEDVDPNEPAIPLGPGLHPTGVIRDYDAKKGYGFIRCKGLPEDVFFPRNALPKSFQGQNIRDMPELKGVQVSFDYNPNGSGGRGPRTDSIQLLLRWLPADKCWLLKRTPIPAKA